MDTTNNNNTIEEKTEITNNSINEKSKNDLKVKEYEQVLITYRENIKVLGQIIAFLAVANVTVVGVAFEKNNYYVFLLGAILMFILYRANHRAAQITLPVVVRGLIIEDQFGEKGLMHYTILKINKFEKFRNVLIQYGIYDKKRSDNLFNNTVEVLNSFKHITLRYDLPFAISKSVTHLIIALMFIQFLLFVIAIIFNVYDLKLPDLNGGDASSDSNG